MQGFGFLSAILVRQNWKRATTTDGEVPPSFNLAKFDLNKNCWLKLFTNRVMIITIRLAVFINYISIEMTFQLNSPIGCFWWSPNPRLKHLLSNHGPRDITMQQQRHRWLCDVMNVMHSNRCVLPIWNERYRLTQAPSVAIMQDNLGKYTLSLEQHINCGKLMNILFWNLILTLIKNVIESI